MLRFQIFNTMFLLLWLFWLFSCAKQGSFSVGISNGNKDHSWAKVNCWGSRTQPTFLVSEVVLSLWYYFSHFPRKGRTCSVGGHEPFTNHSSLRSCGDRLPLLWRHKYSLFFHWATGLVRDKKYFLADYDNIQN